MQKVGWVLLVIGVLVGAASDATPQSGVRLWSPCPPDAKPSESYATLVLRLNDHVQNRFESFDEFGMARMVRHDQHNASDLNFMAETEDEHQMLCALQTERLDVALYIAGRGILGYEGKRPANDLFRPANSATVSEPVRVSGTFATAELPRSADIATVAKTAFRVGDVEATANGWTLVGFSTPASQDACIRCHNGEVTAGVPMPMLFPDAPRLVVNDTIGVVVYAFRSKEHKVAGRHALEQPSQGRVD